MHRLRDLRACFAVLCPLSPALRLLGLGGGALLLWAAQAAAGQVSLAWDAVSAPTLAGYRLYYGQASQTYTADIDVGLTTSYIVTGLTDGPIYYFAVTAYDTAGDESAFSNEVNTTLSSLTGLVAAYNFDKGIVTATWSGIPNPTTTDWLGLYAADAADMAFLDWLYVSCSQTPGSAQASGSCPFTVPATVAPGAYQLRLLANNGFTRLATSNAFTVTSPPGAFVPGLGH